MTNEEVQQMKDEITSITKDELVGGSLKIGGARVGGPVGSALDSLGDKFLDRAQENKEKWGYNR